MNEVKDKLLKVEERFACGEIEREVYMNVSGKLRAEFDNLGKAMESVTQNFSNPDDLINFAIEMAVKLGESWEEGKLYQKTALQNLLFPIGLHYNYLN